MIWIQSSLTCLLVYVREIILSRESPARAKARYVKNCAGRGYVAILGDRELGYQGDPTTGEKTEGRCHEHHIGDVEKIRSLAANQDDEATFFCGGSRNFKQFIDLFDEVFILDIDADTLNERLDNRPDDDWGKRTSERELILRLHATKEDIPSTRIVLDATQPLVSVVDEILSHVRIVKVKNSN